MADRVVITFDGDAKGLIATTNAATRSLTDFDKTVGRSLNNFDNSLKSTGATAAKTGSQIKAQNTNFLNFGRVIQDLPFGFIGIQNNLTQLIPSVGAIGIGFSVLVSALTFLQVGTDNWTRGLFNNKKAVDALTLSGDEYANTLEAVRQATLKGTQESASELINFEQLYKVYQNANLPLKERKQAYKELQDLYPDYFKNIKFEQEASVKTIGVYYNLTAAIVASGRARASVDRITNNEVRRLENEQKIIDLEKQQIKNQNTLNKAKNSEEGQLISGGATGGVASNIVSVNKTSKALKEVEKTQKSINNLITDSNRLTEQNFNLSKNISKELKVEGSSLTGSVGNLNEVEKSGKKLKSLADIMKELNIDLAQTEAKFDTSFNEKRVRNIDDYQKAIDSLIQNGYNKASDAVQNLINKQEELLANLKKGGGRLVNTTGGVKATDVTGKLTLKNAVVDFSNAPTIVGAKIDFTPLISGFIGDFNRGLSTLSQGSFNVLRNIAFNFGDLLNNQIQNNFANQLQKTLDDLSKGLAITTKQLVTGLAGIVGNAISGLSNPTSGVGQGIGGALTGAAAGLAFGPIGAAVGGLAGLLGGILGASKARKQEEIQKKQLAEAEKQTKLLEQSNALAYTSQIIGRMTNQGTVTGFEINSMGNLVAKIQGKDLLIMLDRAVEAKRRGI